ncbi:DUF4276 family protein [Frankia sp. Cr1]|uniref:DUF4276 family protein n=1 Tax=Frankia sp. Cr1 TaxID=3073931 RepID=UPI002AD57D61|nr:DUF4276 family protein [Frankia sp. Cr1]
MTPTTIAMVVEGQGEVAALPVLVRRMAAELAPGSWVDLPRPYRVNRGTLVGAGGLETVVAAVAEQVGPAGGVLIMIDADDDCPAELGPRLLGRARAVCPGLAVSVVLANREFEAWFLAAAPSLSGERGLAQGLECPVDVEKPRHCKGWLSAHRTDGRSYKPVSDQAALAALVNLRMARKYSPSFDKFWRDVGHLLTGEEQ